MKFGLVQFSTDYSLPIADLGRAAEARGFESLWVPEHTHMPSNHSPWPGGAELPKQYSHSVDPFVALAAVAGATSTIKLGTGIALVPQRDTITLAKEVASLDHLSNGRFLFGIGAGWNRPEVENHGVKFSLRWRRMREQILAMKEIWTRDEAEFHGDHVNFDPMWSWPKPVQKPHPPIIMGGDGPNTFARILDYGDEWMPIIGRSAVPFADRVAELQRRAAEAGRAPIPISVFFAPTDPAKIEELGRLGVSRCIFGLPSAGADEVMPLLEQCTEVVRRFG